jgi:hypothetical protein
MEEKRNNGAPLSSWKEIASFLGVSERTAQKWEAERALPVQRMPGTRGRISADPEALARWRSETLRGPSLRSRRRPLQYYAAVATALIGILAYFLVRGHFTTQPAGPAVAHRLDGSTLTVTDKDGNVAWRHAFSDPFFAASYDSYIADKERKVLHVSLGAGDNSTRTLFVYDPITREKAGTTLFCFSQRGEVQWQFTPGKVVSDQAETFSRVYYITDFHVAQLEKGGPERILVTSHHAQWEPCQFAILDAGTGQVVSEYWHSGFLPMMEIADLDGDGTQDVLLGGVNNGYHAATLVVLDPRNVAGASTQAPGDHTQLKGFAPGTEKAVLLFPRTCINLACCASTFNVITRLAVLATGVELDVKEVENDGSATVIYRLDDNLNVLNAEYSDRLKNLHTQMRAKGQLDHALSQTEIDKLKTLRFLKRPDWIK